MEITYPRLIRRIQAVLIDSGVLIIFLAVSFYVLYLIPNSHPVIKGALLIFPYLLYEPLLVSMTGGSIGHHFKKLRVVSVNTQNNLNIFLAIFRCIIKILLGWLSMLFVLTTKKHQAIHDFVSCSIVINKENAHIPEHEKLQERIKDTEYIYPSVIRRISVIIFYLLVIFILASIFVGTTLSDDCLSYNVECTLLEGAIQTVVSYSILFAMAYIIVAGWIGKLYGCRKEKTSNKSFRKDI